MGHRARLGRVFEGSEHYGVIRRTSYFAETHQPLSTPFDKRDLPTAAIKNGVGKRPQLITNLVIFICSRCLFSQRFQTRGNSRNKFKKGEGDTKKKSHYCGGKELRPEVEERTCYVVHIAPCKPFFGLFFASLIYEQEVRGVCLYVHSSCSISILSLHAKMIQLLRKRKKDRTPYGERIFCVVYDCEQRVFLCTILYMYGSSDRRRRKRSKDRYVQKSKEIRRTQSYSTKQETTRIENRTEGQLIA